MKENAIVTLTSNLQPSFEAIRRDVKDYKNKKKGSAPEEIIGCGSI